MKKEIEEMVKNGIWIDVDLDNITIKAPTNYIRNLSEKQKDDLAKGIVSVINQSLHKLQVQ